jgi:hypothetical protein
VSIPSTNPHGPDRRAVVEEDGLLVGLDNPTDLARIVLPKPGGTIAFDTSDPFFASFPDKTTHVVLTMGDHRIVDGSFTVQAHVEGPHVVVNADRQQSTSCCGMAVKPPVILVDEGPNLWRLWDPSASDQSGFGTSAQPLQYVLELAADGTLSWHGNPPPP